MVLALTYWTKFQRTNKAEKLIIHTFTKLNKRFFTEIILLFQENIHIRNRDFRFYMQTFALTSQLLVCEANWNILFEVSFRKGNNDHFLNTFEFHHVKFASSIINGTNNRFEAFSCSKTIFMAYNGKFYVYASSIVDFCKYKGGIL